MPVRVRGLKKETTDFINEKSVLNPAVGEVEKSNSIMLYLTRPVNNKTATYLCYRRCGLYQYVGIVSE